jgi:hypothetical protein
MRKDFLVMLVVNMMKTTTSLPTGSPGCDYSPSYGHQVLPQSEDVPHNIKFDKIPQTDGSWKLTMSGNMECPLDSVYVEDSFVGFVVKTFASG